MTITTRLAELKDLDAIAALIVADAKARTSAAPGLWRMDAAAHEKTRAAIKSAMEAKTPPFRQCWIVAEANGALVGVTHSILLPVPPIYAGVFGPPGLIMEDCCVTDAAPPETAAVLLAATQEDLIAAGARILLASSVPGGVWEARFSAQGYAPLTRYFAKTGLGLDTQVAPVRQANAGDVADIVQASAAHRRMLEALHPVFWQAHSEADSRFGAWMSRSLTLPDREMYVAQSAGRFGGYAISQPATPLHFPTPHDISGVGVVDDFHHAALEHAQSPRTDLDEAAALFIAAEAARARRGDHSLLVVCPADWHAKAALLEGLGYRNAITWHIRDLT